MRVALLTDSSRNAGGLFYSVRWLCGSLLDYDCSPVVLSVLNKYSLQDLHAWDPVPVELFRGFGPLRTMPGLRHRLCAMETDLIHLHGIWMDNQWAALHCQKKHDVPVLISPRGMLDPWAVRNAAWKKRIVDRLFARESLERATCIHALCRSEAESIRRYGLKNPIAVIPNGVALPEIQQERRNTETQKRLLFLGRIHPKKGLKELLQGWSLVQQSNAGVSKDWKLLIAGWDDGGHESGLRNLAAERGLDHSVEFIGPKYGEEKETLLRSVDAFILPSYSEGLPMSVLEAWSYAVPVVMTEFCNLPEGYSHNAAVRISPSADSISRGLEELFSLPEDALTSLGRNGRKLVEQKFTWHKIGKDMMEVYKWCASGASPPACLQWD